MSLTVANIFELAAKLISDGTSKYCCHAILKVQNISPYNAQGLYIYNEMPSEASTFFVENFKPARVKELEDKLAAGTELTDDEKDEWEGFENGGWWSEQDKALRVIRLYEAAALWRKLN